MDPSLPVVWFSATPGLDAFAWNGLPLVQRCRLDAMTSGAGQRAAAWWLANQLLGQVLQADPRQVLWSHDASGRPQVTDNALQLSLSHCAGCVAVALAAGPVGVDVESLGRRADWRGVSRRVFAPAEQAALEALPEQRLPAAALQLWSAREAWGKAAGQGIATLARRPLFNWQGGAWRPLASGFWQTALDGHLLSVALPGRPASAGPAVFRVQPVPAGRGGQPQVSAATTDWNHNSDAD